MSTTTPGGFRVDFGVPQKPPRAGRKSKYDERVDAVTVHNRTHPDAWGIVGEYASMETGRSTASYLRSKYPTHDFNATQTEDGRNVVWARAKQQS